MTTFRFGGFEWDEGACRASFGYSSWYPPKLESASALSLPERHRPHSEKFTRMARKSETDLSRYDLARGTRGKYFEKARRSFETIVVDKKVAAVLGGPEGVTALLEALAKSVGQAKRKRRAA